MVYEKENNKVVKGNLSYILIGIAVTFTLKFILLRRKIKWKELVLEQL